MATTGWNLKVMRGGANRLPHLRNLLPNCYQTDCYLTEQVGSEGLIRGGSAPSIDGLGNTGERAGKLWLSCFMKSRRIFPQGVAADLRHHHSSGEIQNADRSFRGNWRKISPGTPATSARQN